MVQKKINYLLNNNNDNNIYYLNLNLNQENLDFFFNKYIIKKFINILLKKGNKFLAEKILYKYFILIKKEFFLIKNKYLFLINFFNQYKHNYYIIFIYILKKLKIPFIIKNVQKGRKGGKTYQVPFLKNINNQLSESMKLIKTNNFKENINIFLITEFKKILINSSKLTKNLSTVYRDAYENRANIHFRWW